jgi:hypothetical protein
MVGFLFKLETTDGAPAEPSTLSSAVPNWGPGETIHFGRRTLRVVAVRDDDADQPPVPALRCRFGGVIPLSNSVYPSSPRLGRVIAAALLTALMALALSAAHADAQSAITKTQAYQQARHCLLASAKVCSVGRRRDGGGYVFFRGYAHYVYWTYHLDNLKQVGRVGLHMGKLPARKRSLLRRCTFVP